METEIEQNLWAPPIQKEVNDINYNCSDCSSLIEILEINEKDNTIKFKCLNEDNEKKMFIKEYLEKMKKYKNNKIKDRSEKHNKKYKSYCFECKHHLCKQCLKSEIHKNKNHTNNKYLYDIEPTEEKINIIEKRILEYEDRIKDLRKEKEKDIELKINKKKIKEKKILENRIKINDKKEEKEIKDINKKYKNYIKEIKIRYE